MTSLLPTKKQPTPTYSFIEDNIDDITHIVINDGLAAGVVFRYGKVRFLPGEMLRVSFDYKIVRNPDLLTDDTIKPIIVSILDDILVKESYGSN
jgi:hypothetical protein